MSLDTRLPENAFILTIMTEKICGIYKITSPSKRVYIGQTRDWHTRYNKYVNSDCVQQTRLYRSFIKHGVDKHKFEILHRCSIKELNDLEIYYIELYQCFNNKLGLNLQSGGNIKYFVSDETREKISKLKKGNTIWLGRKHSEKSKLLISEVQKGKKQTEESNIKRSISLTGKKRSNEARLNISKGKTGYKMPESTKQKLREANLGKILSQETKNKMSISRKGINTWTKGIPRSNETKHKISLAGIGRIHTDESKLKMSKKRKGRLITLEQRMKISESMKVYHLHKQIQQQS